MRFTGEGVRSARSWTRRTNGDARPGFAPVAVRLIDLDVPVGDLIAPDAGYGEALVLVRLHSEPLGMTRIPLRDGCAARAAIAATILDELGRQLQAHAERHGCLPGEGLTPEALLDGLAAEGSGCPAEHPNVGDAPLVDVIVPTAGRPQAIRSCIQGLQRLDYPRFRVFVVDNRPTDSTRAVVDELRAGDPRIHYVAEPRPGSSVARNRGIAESSADILAFTDDDVAVDPSWLSWLVDGFRSDPAVTVVTGLVMPTDLDTPAKLRFEEEQLGFGKGFRRRVFDLGPHRAPEIPLFPWGGAFGSGNNMAFRRRPLVALGGFDPALGAGSRALAGADIEAFTHALLKGGRLVYEPRALCWHDHRSEESALVGQLFNYRVGFTAILTKWMLRRPHQLGAALLRALPAAGLGRGDGVMAPHEAERLRRQLRTTIQRSMFAPQLKGYLLGPALYLRSVIWARRLRLHAALLPVQVSTATIATPAALRTIDVEAPLQDIALDHSPTPYRALVVIPRREGRPLGSAVLDVGPDQRVPATEIADALRAKLAHSAPPAPAAKAPATFPSVSVVVPTCADRARLERSLPSILESDHDPLEVLVVENRPQRSRTRAWLAERFDGDDRLRYVEEPRAGAARARNRGLAEASGEIVAFVDDDIVVDRSWLRTGLAAFAGDPRIGCVTGLILPPQLDAPQLVFEQFSSFGKGFEPMRFSLPETRAADPLFPYTPGYIGSGANTFLRTELARSLGGFDTRLGPATPSRGGEEIDLYIRVLHTGAQIVYEPGSIVWHEHPTDLAYLHRYAFRLGVGLGAMLTKRLIEGPERRRLVRLAPRGVRYAFDPGSRKNALKAPDFPRRLDAVERLGMLAGPPSYLASAALSLVARS